MTSPPILGHSQDTVALHEEQHQGPNISESRGKLKEKPWVTQTELQRGVWFCVEQEIQFSCDVC